MLEKIIRNIFDEIRMLEGYLPKKDNELKKLLNEAAYKLAVVVENLEFYQKVSGE